MDTTNRDRQRDRDRQREPQLAVTQLVFCVGDWGHQGAATSGLGTVCRQAPQMPHPWPLFLTQDSWAQVLVPRPAMAVGHELAGGQTVTFLCHLQSSGQLLGGRGPALGRPRKGPLWWPARCAVIRGSRAYRPWGHQLRWPARRGQLHWAPPFMARPAGSQWTHPQAKQGELCPFSGRWGLLAFSLEPLSQADPGGPGPCGRAAVTPAHPRQGGSHVSCLAQWPPSVPVIGRATRRVLLTPQQRGQAWGGELAPFISQAPNYPFLWPRPRCF